MNKQEIMGLVDSIMEESHVAVLATSDHEGKPHVRWMTPCCTRDRPWAIFMVSAVKFAKVDQAREHPDIELMLQSKALDKIINVRGRMNVLENPSIRAEVLETIGNRLSTFWHANQQASDLVVLEVIVEEVTYYVPLRGSKLTVSFVEGEYDEK